MIDSSTPLRIGSRRDRRRQWFGPYLHPFLFVIALGAGALAPPVGAAHRAADAWTEAGTTDELAKLRTKLRDSNKFVRRDAVKALAKRSEPEAWSLLVEALGDATGEVADSAAFFLAELPVGVGPDAKAFETLREELLGKRGLGARSERVRRYAAELVGRVPGLTGRPAFEKALAKAFRDKDPVTRRLAIHAVGVIGEREGGEAVAGLADDLERALAKDKDPLVRARALAAHAQVAADRSTWIPAGDDDADEVRAAWVVTAAGTEAVALERRVRSERDHAQRQQLLELLVERLGTESEAALRWRVLDTLRGLTGRKSGFDPRPWRAFVEGLDAGWEPQASAPETSEREGGGDGERSATLAGLPIRSGSVAFLIDFSGSIWRERADGKTIKQVLDEELRAALEGLPESARFALVPFTAEPHPWRDELSEASPRNVAKALDWFEGARFEGTGNAWDALVLAQDLPEVDTIVLLTDGAPTGGTRHRLETIAALYSERNLGRQVVLDCILVDAPKRLRRIWAELSRTTGGRMHAISLR